MNKMKKKNCGVLGNLKLLLDHGGYGLDSSNMTALCIIVESVRVGRNGTVADVLADWRTI